MPGKIIISHVNDETCVVWTIDNFDTIRVVEIISEPFSYGDHELQLSIFPNGEAWFEATSLTSPVLSMRLIVRRSYLAIYPAYNIEYIMGIKNRDLSEFRNEMQLSKLNADERSTPAHELIERRHLDLHADTLTVFCNIRYEKKNPAINYAPSTSSTYDGVLTLSEHFRDVYFNQRYTDVKIKVRNKEFLAHKVILCTRSEVFAAMFEHDTAEKRSGVVTITDSDPESFECFLLYLYTGKLDTVSSVNVANVYKIASKYDLKGLKKECIGYMIKGMSVESLCDIFHLAIMHNDSDLLSGVSDFFIRNSNVILTSKEWLILLEENASLCNELLVKVAKSRIQK